MLFNLTMEILDNHFIKEECHEKFMKELNETVSNIVAKYHYKQDRK
jgi:hypothetical protein